MITHLQVATIEVSDQDRAIDFYVNKLGFRLRGDMQMPDGARWIEVLPEGAQTSFTLEPAANAAVATNKHSGYVLSTDDVQAEYARLLSLGVEFVLAPTFQGWGTYSEFVDPDGNIFGLATASNVQRDLAYLTADYYYCHMKHLYSPRKGAFCGSWISDISDARHTNSFSL